MLSKYRVGVWKYVTVAAPDPDVAAAIALAALPGEGWQTVDEPERVEPEPESRLDYDALTEALARKRRGER